jgi:hypothetical protein
MFADTDSLAFAIITKLHTIDFGIWLPYHERILNSLATRYTNHNFYCLKIIRSFTSTKVLTLVMIFKLHSL